MQIPFPATGAEGPALDPNAQAYTPGSHRRKLGKSNFEDLPASLRLSATRLAVILRLAVVLNRSRTDDLSPVIRAAGAGKLELTLPQNWLAAHLPISSRAFLGLIAAR